MAGRRWGQASGPGNRGGVSANCIWQHRRGGVSPKALRRAGEGWGRHSSHRCAVPRLGPRPRDDAGDDAAPFGNVLAPAYLVSVPSNNEASGIYYCYTIGSAAWTADAAQPNTAKSEPTTWVFTLDAMDPSHSGDVYQLLATTSGWFPGATTDANGAPGVWTITSPTATLETSKNGDVGPDLAGWPGGVTVTAVKTPEPGMAPGVNDYNRMTKWTGVNLAGFDYGTLARAGGA